MGLGDDHPDGPDPLRDSVWEEAVTAMALEAELAFERPPFRFGEIRTDAKLDAVLQREETDQDPE